VVIVNTVFYGVVEEEKERNLARQKVCKEKIDALPKGYLTQKTSKGTKYYYLQRREGQKFSAVYIGNDKEKVEKIKYQIAERKHLEGILKRLNLEYKQMCKVVKE